MRRMKVRSWRDGSNARCWLVYCPGCNEDHSEVPVDGEFVTSVQHETPGPAIEYAMMHLWQHGGEL